VRREIQGLRAVAVLLVVLFHLWPGRLPGGYIGVDVFFVISGFLITSLLLREVDRSGSVSLTRFWARRLRRLLPASYLVLVVSAAAVLLLEPRLVWHQFFGEILAAGLYVENWALAFNSVNYLAAQNTPSPAQHYWTLSAEEQFYLVWPLLVLLALWLAARWSRRKLPAVFAVLAVGTTASLGYSLWITAHDPAWAYFVTPARAWEFGAGALLAFAPTVSGRAALRSVVGWTALAALVASSLVFDAKTPMPGTAAILVVVASAAVIWVGDPAASWSHSRLLTLRPAEWLGDISYSIYLWHWPLIILLPAATGHPLTLLDRGSILMATIGLAALTKKWVEDPIRQARHFGLARSRTTFAYAAAAAVLLTVACVVPRTVVERDAEHAVEVAQQIAQHEPACFGAAAMVPQAKGCPNDDLDGVMVPTPDAAAKDDPPWSHCYWRAFKDPLVPCQFGKRSNRVPHVAVIGDSHARVLMATVDRLVEQGRITADMYVMGECAWSTAPVDMSREIGRTCAHWRSNLFPLLDRKATDYDLVLTTARLLTLRGSHETQVRGFSEAWSRVTSHGVPVAVVRDNPEVPKPAQNPNLCLAKVSVSQANASCAFTRAANLDPWYDALRVAQRRTPGTTWIDLTDRMCKELTCPVLIGGVDVYADGNHLTVTFARTLAPYLYSALVTDHLLPAQRPKSSQKS
jgi:peptidoglycan/LPS O-acetylase OafA/YrhL